MYPKTIVQTEVSARNFGQCLPCENCYEHFPFVKYTTNKELPRHSKHCKMLHCFLFFKIIPSPHICNYTYGNASNDLTQCVLAKERSLSLQLQDRKLTMVISLGGGPLSLISQLGSSFGRKKFVKCLVPFHSDPNITSRVSFGDGCEVLGHDVVSKPNTA